jgi:HAD superfamily hydrolase (TIGR01509 family)
VIKLPPPADWPWQFRSVVFDLDGLIVDTEPIFEQVAHCLLAKRGLSLAPGIAQAVMGTPAAQTLQFFRDHYRLTETIAELDAECSQLFWEVFAVRPAALLPGVRELLDRLERRRIPTAIATSSGRSYLARILEPHGLLGCFRFALTCEDVLHGKPHPEIYEKAASQFGHAAADMVVLEDSPNGLRAAQAAGARCVVVPHERVPKSHIGSADAVIASLAAPELYELLGI